MEDVKHICIVCGHEHDEDLEGRWEDLGNDFREAFHTYAPFF